MHPGGSDHDGLERLGVIGEILDEPFAVGKVPPHLEHSTVLGIQIHPIRLLGIAIDESHSHHRCTVRHLEGDLLPVRRAVTSPGGLGGSVNQIGRLVSHQPPLDATAWIGCAGGARRDRRHWSALPGVGGRGVRDIVRRYGDDGVRCSGVDAGRPDHDSTHQDPHRQSEQDPEHPPTAKGPGGTGR